MKLLQLLEAVNSQTLLQVMHRMRDEVIRTCGRTHGQCESMADDLANELEAMGYSGRVIRGRYMNPENGDPFMGHDWVVLDDGTLLDPSVEQFGSNAFITKQGHPYQEDEIMRSFGQLTETIDVQYPSMMSADSIEDYIYNQGSWSSEAGSAMTESVRIDELKLLEAIDPDHIELKYEENTEKENRSFVVDTISAYLDGKHVGYLKLSYVPKELFHKFFPSVLHFESIMGGRGYIPYDLRNDHRHWSEYDEETLRKILMSILVSYAWDKQNLAKTLPLEQVTALIRKFENKMAMEKGSSSYKFFYSRFVDKPFVDYINVDDGHPILAKKFGRDPGIEGEDHRRNGIGSILYRAGAAWMKKRGMRMYASGLQSDEAKAAWEKMTAQNKVGTDKGRRYYKESRLDELSQGALTTLRQKMDNGENVIAWLKGTGWKQIGNPSVFSQVLANPSSPYIIKALEDGNTMRRPEARCGLQWLRYCNKNYLTNPHLPRVYYVKTGPYIKESEESEDNFWALFPTKKNDKTVYLAVMEKLEEFDVNKFYAGMDEEQRLYMATLLYLIIRSNFSVYVMPSDASDEFMDDVQRNAAGLISRTPAYQTHPLMKANQAVMKIMNASGCDNDLHHKNIMLRPGTNELVINDPLSEW